MHSAVLFVLLVIILFILIIVNNLYEKKTTYIFLALSIIIGIIFYSYGYYYVSDKSPSSIGISALKSIFAIFGMVAGKSSLSDISSVPLYNNPFILLLFYIIHLFIYTLVITTLLVNFGKHLILTINNFFRLLIPKKNIFIFYKLNDRTKKVINTIDENDNQIIILDDYFLRDKNDNFSDIVIKKNAVVLEGSIYKEDKDKNLIISNRKFKNILVSDKYKNSNIRLYLLNDDIDDNYRFSNIICDFLSNENKKNNIKLTIFMDEKYDIKYFQNKNVFDYIRRFNQKEITSRVLVKNYPPSKYIEFENFKAKENESFNCLIIGFGALAQNVIKKLYIYGHFVDTRFNLHIVDMNYKNISGEFHHDFSFINDDNVYLNKWTDISFGAYDARSDEFYKYFMENKEKLDYVVISTGNEKTNEDIVKNILKMRNEYNLHFDLFDMLDDRIFAYEYTDSKNIKLEYNSIDYVIDDRIDTAGKWISLFFENKTDFDPIKDKNEIDKHWQEKFSYDKDNCISTADFYTSILKASGYKNIDFKNENYDKDILEELEKNFDKDKDTNYYNITAIDHDRWSSYVLIEQGYKYMNDEYWDKRAENYDKKIKINNKYKIQNDTENKYHAYIRSMEDLQKLYIKERKVTGGDPTIRWSKINNFSMAMFIAKNINSLNT